MIKCDASWTSEIYDNFDQYVKGKLKLSTTGYGIQALPETDVKKTFSQVSFEASMPSLFTRDEGFSTSVTNARDFFKKVFSNQLIFFLKIFIKYKVRKEAPSWCLRPSASLTELTSGIYRIRASDFH